MVKSDSKHLMTDKDKMLIREKNKEIESTRDKRLGKIEHMKRQNAKKKDRNFRYKLSQVHMSEGDKALRNALARGDNHNYMVAADCFTDALYMEPNQPVAHEKRANCWKSRGEYELAFVDMTQAILKSETSNAAYFAARAGLLVHMEDYKRR